MSNQSFELNHLEKLAELKDKGVLTQEEFDQKKKQILDFTGDQSKEEPTTKKKNKHLVLSVILLVTSLVFLVAALPDDIPSYRVMPELTVKILAWSIFIGIIAYFFRKDGRFLFIFSILFFLASVFNLAVSIYERSLFY